MKKITLILLLTIYSFGYDVFVSIAPQVSMLKAIGGSKLSVSVLVPSGASPHTFSPKPKDMIKLSKAKAYFGIGVEFEDVWLKKFSSQNPSLKVVDLSQGIKKINNNPHIRLSFKILSVMAKKAKDTLIMIDGKNSEFYEKNYQNYLKQLQACHDSIQKMLEKKKQRVFMTFHPAFTYFAKEFNLTQVAVEIDGKEPSLRELLKVIKIAKEKKITTIITSPEFSDKSARVIAKELGATIIMISPLNPNICNTTKLIANTLR